MAAAPRSARMTAPTDPKIDGDPSDDIDDRAHAVAVAQERIASLEDDVARYRELALATMDALRAVTLQHDVWRERYRALADEYRSMCREQLIRAGVDV